MSHSPGLWLLPLSDLGDALLLTQHSFSSYCCLDWSTACTQVHSSPRCAPDGTPPISDGSALTSVVAWKGPS